jgi:hypothetical protein
VWTSKYSEKKQLAWEQKPSGAFILLLLLLSLYMQPAGICDLFNSYPANVEKMVSS